MIDIKTEFGTITVTKGIIAQMAEDAVAAQKGKAFLTNNKGKQIGIAGKIGMMDDADLIEINKKNDSVEIKLYIMMQFGASIEAVTGRIAQDIKDEMEKTTGTVPAGITIVVKGMISSSGNVVKRNIQVKK